MRWSAYMAAAVLAVLCLSCLSCGRRDAAAALERHIAAISSYQEGKLDKAIAEAAEAERMDDTLVAASILKGKAEFFSDDLGSALASFSLALKAQPASIEARLWQARCLRYLKRQPEAIEACESALALAPNLVELLRLRAAMAMDDDDVATAALCLDRAASNAQEFALVFMDRAALRWAAGHAEGARDDLKVALSLLPPGSPARKGATDLLSAVEAGL
ncbi:MAG: hypothetical protein KBB32_05805 [Spirochaetia bacterium]|nr:hypothetical protein [Spirochaetia bacterium]